MNRRQKIIVSVVGIFIVLLTLVGITYGYFLTRIQGNTNTTSISVNTADLKLVYSDGSTQVITGDKIMPNTVIGEKDFTVTNEGNDTSYVVVIDGNGDISDGITPVDVKYATSGTTRSGVSYNAGDSTTYVSNDFVYTLTCASNIEGNTCNEQSFEMSFPMNGGVIVGNNIVEDEVHTYTLKVTYLETNEDQTDDMNKTFNAQVNIVDIRSLNPYSDNKSSLAYNIINNSLLEKNGTQFVNNPLTTPAKGTGNKVYTSYTDPTSFSKTSSYTSKWYVYGTAITMDKDGWFKIINPQVGQFNSAATSMINGYISLYMGYDDEESARAVMNDEFQYIYKVGTSTTTSELYYKLVNKNSENIESVLSVTADDYGTSYYYRGGVTDNYVNFAGMCWRIVRIEGDGSVKLILEDRYEQCNDKEGNDLNNNGTYFVGNWIDNNEETNGFRGVAFGYKDNYKINYLNYEGGLADAFEIFQTSKLSPSDINKLKIDEWCYDDKISSIDDNGNGEYNASTRIYTNYKPSLICTGTKLTKFRDNTDMYVATLTVDEMSFAGISNDSDDSYYLMNSYVLEEFADWWALSPSFFETEGDAAFIMGDMGYLSNVDVEAVSYSRPAVTLKSGSVITEGVGTQEKPYVIG